MDDLERSAQLASEALNELRRSGVLSVKTLDKLNAAIKANAGELEKSAEEIEKEAKAREQLTKDLIRLGRDIGSAAQAVRENREDFRSLKPAVEATGAVMKMSIDKIGSGITAVGEVISGIGAFVPRFGTIISAVGAGVSKTGDIVKKYGKEAVDAATHFAKFSLDEVQRVVGAFRELGDVGGITGDSMRGLQKDAQALGLSMDTYAKLIARNSEGLAATGITVTAGAQTLKQITTAGTEFEDKFVKLGFSFEAQSEFAAKFLAQQRNLTRINLEDTKALSEANRKYMEQVDELSRLTGLSKDKVANELEAMSRELRFGATLAIAEQKGTAKSIAKAAKVLETQGSKEIAEGFKDIFGGTTTERSKELMAATGGAAAGLADDLENGRISFTEFMQKFQQSVRETRQALGADEFERRVGKLGTVLDPMLVGMRRLDKAQDFNAETLGRATEEQKKAGEAKGKEINDIVDAQKSLRDFAVTMDKIVSDKLFPVMAAGVKRFTTTINEAADTLGKILGVTAPASAPSRTEQGRSPQQPAFGRQGQPIGQPGPKPSDDYLSKVMKLESGGKNIGNVPVPGRKATSAHGLFQITEGTFRGIVANAPTDSILKGKTFEDMKLDTNLQTEAMKLLTQENARRLGQAGLSTSDAAKYMAHMLGYGGASKVLGANGSTPISRLLSQEAIANNKLERFTTAGELRAEFDRRTGGAGYRYGGVTSGPKSGYLATLHGTEAVIPLANGRNVPVEMTGMSTAMGEQVSILTEQVGRFDQMINLLQSSVDMQGKILRAAQG